MRLRGDNGRRGGAEVEDDGQHRFGAGQLDDVIALVLVKGAHYAVAAGGGGGSGLIAAVGNRSFVVVKMLKADSVQATADGHFQIGRGRRRRIRLGESGLVVERRVVVGVMVVLVEDVIRM